MSKTGDRLVMLTRMDPEAWRRDCVAASVGRSAIVEEA
jgi:hypothetical protein